MNAVVEVKLTPEEDTFCLAVIEHAGNLAAAHRAAFGPDQSYPLARARELIARPEIAKRIRFLSEAVEEHAIISLGSHLQQLARIRDHAFDNAQLKVALGAEKARGEAAGLYADKLPKDPSGKEGRPLVSIHIGATPANTGEWAQKYGNAPVIIEAQPAK